MSFPPPQSQSPLGVETAGNHARELHEAALRAADERRRDKSNDRPGVFRRIINALNGKRALK